MKALLTAALTTLSVISGCGPDVILEPPPGEILLYVDTNAPMPAASGGQASRGPPPLFDRLRIDILQPGSSSPCDTCTNEFSLDADTLAAKSASVGISSPRGVSGYRARVRLFLSKFTLGSGDPFPDATIDVTVALPAASPHGETAVTVLLDTDDVGAPVGSPDSPVDPLPGAPTSSFVGTWPGAQQVPCTAPPGEGQVCIPGGAYWMGTSRPLDLPTGDESPPRLIVLSPFYFDSTEATVTEYRASGAQQVSPWDGKNSGGNILDFCTFTATAGPHEDLPVNCVNWFEARSYCQSRGGDLPTEAQFEYVASGLLGQPYVWGTDPPACGDATFGRSGYGIFAGANAPCQPTTPPGGALPVGSGARDRLDLGAAGTVFDLAGNVAEWSLDIFNWRTEPCWSQPGVYTDPLCNKVASGEILARTVRGGDWIVTAGIIVATRRSTFIPSGGGGEVGVRCARPG